MRESRRWALTEAQLIKTGSATSEEATGYTTIHVYDHVNAARHRRRRSPGHRVVGSSLGSDRSIALQGYRKHTDTLRSRFDSSWESDFDGL